MAEFSLHTLQAPRGRRTARRVGRGSGSGRGTFSGRGIKGQRARSGGRTGLRRRTMKIQLQSKPKIGGFTSQYPKMATVNIQDLSRRFDAGAVVNPKRLLTVGLVEQTRSGVKILGEGKLDKKLTVIADAFSESAKRAILEAGGSATVIVRTRVSAKPKKDSKK